MSDLPAKRIWDKFIVVPRYRCPELDEWRCSECSGHNRCEFEMEAGWGEYEAPDRDR